MSEIFETILGRINDFFEPVPEIRNDFSSRTSAGFLIFLMFAVFILFCLYAMNEFASSGALGAVGLGAILFIAWALPLVANFIASGTRLRGFILSATVVTAFFFYFVDYMLKNAKHPHDAVHQQLFQAMK